MSRPAVHIRPVRLDDAEDLLALWQLPTRPTSAEDPLTEVSSSVRRVLASDRERIVVAEYAGRVAGAVHLRIGSFGPLGSERAVFASHLCVDPDLRRRGVARGLMEAATTWAEEQAVAHVLAFSPVGQREGNRFMARLGLAPAATVRIASTPTLRAKLPVEVPGMVAMTRPARESRQLGQVLAQRRSARRQQRVGQP